MARNKFDIDERLETPFSLKHLKRSMVYVKKHSRRMILATVLTMLGSVAALFTPKLLQYALDVAIPNKDKVMLVVASAAVALLLALSIWLTRKRSQIMIVVGQSIIFDIRKDLFEHLQELPFDYFDSRPHGKILVRVVQYVNNVSDMLSNGIINIIMDVFNVVIIAVFMFTTNVVLSLVIMAGLPILLTILLIIKPAQRRAWQSFSNKSSNFNAYIHENISGIKVTQIFVREELNKTIFSKLIDQYNRALFKAAVISNLVWVTVENVSTIALACLFFFGALVSKPMVSFGILTSMSSYSSRFWQPINNIAVLYNQFMNTIAYLERIFETIDEPVKIADAPDAYDIGEIKGQVVFDHVTFGYEPGQTILEDLSFTVKPGESVALVGPTGAGKSTIVNLISRFYDLRSGHVLIDGNDVSKVTLKSLRSSMGIMLQDSFLFSGTIMENVKYGKLDATDEEVYAACKTVMADEFIRHLDKGYKTEIHERGGSLSQGQRQLISFARTLISDPKILILDEATSSIDTQTERLVQQGLNRMLKGRTSFIIAHRLSTIKSCDKIMVISDRGIKECGTHDELMAKRGAYFELYNAQLVSGKV